MGLVIIALFKPNLVVQENFLEITFGPFINDEYDFVIHFLTGSDQSKLGIAIPQWEAILTIL